MNRLDPLEATKSSGRDSLNPGVHNETSALRTPPKSTLALRIAFLILCLVGGVLSADLLRLHFRVHTDPNYHSLCAISETIDCESVAFSSYAVAAGLPVALWGLIGYLFMGGLCIWGLHRSQRANVWPFGTLFWLSLIASLVGVSLFSVSARLIHSICILCIATYAVNLSLWAVAFAELKRLKIGPFSALREELEQLPVRRAGLSFYVLTAVTLIVILELSIPAYWHTEISEGPGGLLTGRTPGKAHWIGARKPAIEITEFSDYQCPYCFRGHVQARRLVHDHPDVVRLVHRHYPLKQHPMAFEYAKMAVCAGDQGKFWEANDFLFTNGRRPEPVTHQEISLALEIDSGEMEACLQRDSTGEAIQEDVLAGQSFNIQGTPTYVIDGKLYPGSIPNSVLSHLLPVGSSSHQ